MFTVIIPARFSSTRLPGKPLALINDKPMIQHVYERAQSSQAERVVVATDDERIVKAVNDFGGEVCMTANSHASGTDRIHEVTTRYQLAEDAIVVNVQGDEPLIPPEVINQVATNLRAHSIAAAATLSEEIQSPEDYDNPNAVKVVKDQAGFALYFSRSPLPFYRDNSPYKTEAKHKLIMAQRHIGIYAYRVSLLNHFIQWPMADLERVESLEQLRILANGEKIHVAQACQAVPAGIDTPEDLLRINQLFHPE